MGIENFKTAPDNKGGRPPKGEAQEDVGQQGRRIYGDPALPAKGKEEWERAMELLGIDSIEENLYEDDTIGSDHIGELCSYAHLFRWDVRIFLEVHGIYETDWWNIPDNYPSTKMLVLLMEDRGLENDYVKRNSTAQSGKKVTGGLAQLINEAKDS